MTEEMKKDETQQDENQQVENTEAVKEEQTQQEEVKEEVAETQEEKKEEKKEEVVEEKKEVEVPAKFKSIVEEIEKMSVIELNELVKVFEEKFGVSAAAVAAAPAGGASDAGGEEQSEFEVVLADAGASKVGVIKAVKTVLALGLKEAKDLVDACPSSLKQGVSKDEAEEMKKAIEEAGGKVEIK